MKRNVLTLLACLVAVASSLGAPSAVAKATTTVTMTNWQSGQHYIDGHHVNFGGYIQPTRPSGTKVYLKRKTSSGWTVLATTTQSVDQGKTNTFYMPVRKVPYAYYVLKACVKATATAAAGCSTTARYAFGHWRTFGNTPAYSHSAGFSVGPIQYQSKKQPGFARWNDSRASGWAVYKLHGKCHKSTLYGLVGVDVASDPISFRAYVDGTAIGPTQMAYSNGGTASATKDLTGVQTLRLTAQAAHPEKGGQDYYGFHALAFCLY